MMLVDTNPGYNKITDIQVKIQKNGVKIIFIDKISSYLVRTIRRDVGGGQHYLY